ncbi:MAG: TrbC/VirB2 family protein [Gammaproteobacteria bacterium]|nr:TrbC/VirB2 family protein [Gammaproteobacteria bacterium]
MFRSILVLITVMGVVFPEWVMAAMEVPKFLKEGDASNTTNEIAQNLATVLYGIAGGVAVIGVIVGALKIMGGEEDAGWKAIKNVVIGGLIIAVVGAIVNIFA